MESFRDNIHGLNSGYAPSAQVVPRSIFCYQYERPTRGWYFDIRFNYV